jgi:hypothetical protein
VLTSGDTLQHYHTNIKIRQLSLQTQLAKLPLRLFELPLGLPHFPEIMITSPLSLLLELVGLALEPSFRPFVFTL